MSIKVIIQNNIFSAEALEKHVPIGTTLGSITSELNINPEKETAYVMVKDDPAKSLDYVTKEDDIILIKIVPTGADNNIAQNIVGGLALAGGIALLFVTGGFAALGSMALFSYAAYAFSDDIQAMMGYGERDPLAPQTSAVSYLRGGKNVIGKDQVIPLILGKHRYLSLIHI